MLIYILIYTLLAPGILYDYFKKKSYRKKYLLALYTFIFILFRGLRWNTGTDWYQYWYHFEHLSFSNIFTYSRYGGEETVEPLYAIINVLIGFLGNYTLFLIVTNLFILYTYAHFSLKYTPKPIITYSLLLLCANFFPVRLELAATILMWCIPHIINRNLVFFTFIVLVASLVHKACIVFFPFYWLLIVPFSVWWQIIIYTICTFIISEKVIRIVLLIITGIIPVESVRSTALNYLNSSFDYENDSIVSGTLSYFMTVFILLAMKYTLAHKRIPFLYTISVNAYFFMSCISQVIPMNLSDVARVGGFFIWGLPLTFSFMFSNIKRKYKLIAVCVLIFYCMYKFMRMCTIFPEELFPYYSIFHSASYVR